MVSQRDTEQPSSDSRAASETIPASQAAVVRQAGQFKPGDVLAARFEVVRYIARGGMGEVYEVADRNLHGVRLALKTIRPQVASFVGMQDRFEREVLLARRVVHPNLCPIYDIFHAEHHGELLLFLTMKLVHGQTLEDRIKRLGKIETGDATRIVQQVAEALEAAHKAGVLHRDVKTANIMLEESPEGLLAYVMDFGLARSYRGDSTVLTAEGVAGTLGYLAPELLRGAPPSVASDVYAYGVTVFRMLTGQMPGAALDAAGRTLREPVKSLIPVEWRRLVEGCLEVSVEKRFQSVAEAVSVLNHGTSRLGRSSIVQRAQPVLSRRGLLVGGAAVALTAGTAGWLERERIAFWLEPLPEKRFVALMEWPNADLPAVLGTVLDSIGSRLARAEKTVKNLLILTAGDLRQEGTTVQTPPDAVSALGANLVLAASLTARPKKVSLKLQVLEAATQKVLRSKTVWRVPDELSSLAQAGCTAAAHLLGLPEQETSLKDEDELRGVSAEVYRLYGEAERMVNKPNDEGLQDAISLYQKALEADPQFALGYARLSMAYTEQFLLKEDAGSLRLAGANAALALKLNPESAKGLLAQGMVQLFSANPRDALKSFATSLEVDPENPETRIDQATVYRNAGRLVEAETVYRAVLINRPNYWLAHNELGFVLEKQAKYKEAAEEFAAAAAAAPNAALPVANQAALYLILDRRDEALDACYRSLKLGMTQAAFMTLGDIDFGKGKYQAALEDYTKGAALNERNHVIWRDIGDCYGMLRQATQAKKSYAKAAELLASDLQRTPKAGSMWATLAFYQAKTGDGSAAKLAMRNAEANGGTDVDSELMIVQALAVLGHNEEALQLLLKCLDRGLAPVEVDFAPDLAGLEKDPRYIARVAALHGSGKA